MILVRFDPKTGVTSFLDIGDRFQHIDREASRKEFDRTAEIEFGNSIDHFKPQTNGFIVHDSGAKVEPIFQGDRYDIFNTLGKLFKPIPNGMIQRPVIVPQGFSADKANELYGERFGYDWVYAS